MHATCAHVLSAHLDTSHVAAYSKILVPVPAACAACVVMAPFRGQAGSGGSGSGVDAASGWVNLAARQNAESGLEKNEVNRGLLAGRGGGRLYSQRRGFRGS